MKDDIERDVIEESVLFGSAIKWIVLSIFVGLIVGFTVGIFVKLVSIGEQSVSHHLKYYYWLLPIIFFITSYLYTKFVPDKERSGTEEAIYAIHKNSGKMNVKAMPVKLFTTFLTIIFGGSVGEEGPATEIGADIASFFAELFKMDKKDRKRFAICGISAGFVAVFGAPVGAAIFSAEILFIGKFTYLALLPALISSYVSYFVGRFLGTKPLLLYYINFKKLNPGYMFLEMFGFGIFIGILSIIFIYVANRVEGAFKRINIYKPLKGLIGGFILITIVLLTDTTDYIGMGEAVINKAISGEKVSSLSFVAKMITSAVTLGSGGKGGIVTPMAYIGSTAGSAWAGMIHSNSLSFYAAVGMVSFLATCCNTPLAGIVMSMEMFGAEVGTYASIVCVIAYVIVGHKSIFPTQVVAISKSPSLYMDKHDEVGKLNKIKVDKRYRGIFEKIIDIKNIDVEDDKNIKENNKDEHKENGI